jgi:hypothetical protein
MAMSSRSPAALASLREHAAQATIGVITFAICSLLLIVVGQQLPVPALIVAGLVSGLAYILLRWWELRRVGVGLLAMGVASVALALMAARGELPSSHRVASLLPKIPPVPAWAIYGTVGAAVLLLAAWNLWVNRPNRPAGVEVRPDEIVPQSSAAEPATSDAAPQQPTAVAPEESAPVEPTPESPKMERQVPARPRAMITVIDSSDGRVMDNESYGMPVFYGEGNRRVDLIRNRGYMDEGPRAAKPSGKQPPPDKPPKNKRTKPKKKKWT